MTITAASATPYFTGWQPGRRGVWQAVGTIGGATLNLVFSYNMTTWGVFEKGTNLTAFGEGVEFVTTCPFVGILVTGGTPNFESQFQPVSEETE